MVPGRECSVQEARRYILAAAATHGLNGAVVDCRAIISRPPATGARAGSRREPAAADAQPRKGLFGLAPRRRRARGVDGYGAGT